MRELIKDIIVYVQSSLSKNLNEDIEIDFSVDTSQLNENSQIYTQKSTDI